MKRVVIFSVVGVALSAIARPAVVVGPWEAKSVEFVLDYDPSMTAVSNTHVTMSNKVPFKERWRIISDLNGDGVDDLILSEPKDMFGNAGGPWMVYLCGDGRWRYVGDVVFYPGVFFLDQVDHGMNLWYCIRADATACHFGYYRVTNGKLDARPVQIRIDATGKEDSVFSRVYMSVFGHPSTHPFSYEESVTSTNGVVVWEKVSDNQPIYRKGMTCGSDTQCGARPNYPSSVGNITRCGPMWRECREKFRFRRLYNDRLPKFRVAALAAMRGAIMKGYENKTEEERVAIWEEFCRRAKATPDERKKAED